MRNAGVKVLLAGTWQRKARTAITPPAGDSFTLGTTRPVPGTNCGVDPAITLTPYTGPNAGGTLTVSTPTTYTNVDFGTTFIKRNTSDLIFNNCKWTNTKVTTQATNFGPMVECYSAGFNATQFNRCTWDNTSQWASGTSAVSGQDFIVNRCAITNFQDGLDPFANSANADGPINVQILGTYIGSLAWWWSPTAGVVHPSDIKTHNDCIQWQGGRGLRVEGCDLQGIYSTTIGTGTPNSGSDTSGQNASSAPYTQATGVSQRYTIVEGNGTYAPGQPGADLGGSISGLMFSTSARGYTPAATVKNNWGSGGSYWLNAGDTALVNDSTLTYSFGEVSGNRVDNNQRIAGWAIGILTGMTANVFSNAWADGSGTIPRKNA